MRRKEQIKQFLTYTGIGISSTIIQYVVYAVLYATTKNYYLGNILAFMVSVFNSYCWNRRLVFCNQSTTVWWRVLIKNYVLYFSTGVIATNFMSYTLIERWSVSPYVSPIIIVLILYPVNYLLNRFWAHKSESEEHNGTCSNKK